MTKILTIDQGTTSSRALIVDADLQVLATDQREFTQYYPHSGWVEHDAEEIWSTVISTVQGAMAKVFGQVTWLVLASQTSVKRW